ncbi:MAG TPA: hypothetical protein VKB28_03440 [Solirubrobacteraceae bacterium]|nr:hypothetical protein [Solirubrobacteraceae bacterium]
MSVRPNIESLDLEGADLVVRGGSDIPLPDVLRVIVTQDGVTEDGRGVEDGAAKEIGVGWKARLKDTKLRKGPADTMGIEVRVSPYEICSWVQQLDIE